MSQSKDGREALEEIERRFAQLMGKLGQTFEEVLSSLPEGKARIHTQTRTRSFTGTVDEFLAARRQSVAAEEAEVVTSEDESEEETETATGASVDLDLGAGKLHVRFADPERAPVEIDLPELRFDTAWQVSVAGGTLRFDPD